jgi:hypothetical protein
VGILHVRSLGYVFMDFIENPSYLLWSSGLCLPLAIDYSW